MSPPAVSPTSRRFPNVLPFSKLSSRYTITSPRLTQRLEDQGSDFKMAPAARRLRPEAGSSGSCSPVGRSPLCACAAASAHPLVLKRVAAPGSGLETWPAVGTGGQQDERWPLPDCFHLLRFHLTNAPVPSWFLPPALTG